MKLVSLNVEKRNHLSRVKTFLDKEEADVVALMEVCEEDLDELLGEYPHRVYGANFQLKESGYNVGVVLASRVKLKDGQVWYADGNPSSDVPIEAKGVHRPVVVGATREGARLVATHFTWTDNMSETDKQKADVGRLLDRFAFEELVLCGDFNIPRGNSTYALLAHQYKDNVPLEVRTTIDFELHRAKREGREKFEVVVDYVWTTPKYTISNVRVIDGVSDHCALVGEITESPSSSRFHR